MSDFHTTSLPLCLTEHTSQWWSTTSGDGHSSDSSSLGAQSSIGTLFSDSGNSQEPNWKNGKVWTSLARDSNNCVQRGWSTSSSGSCTSARDGQGDPNPRAEASLHPSGEDLRGTSSLPSPSPLRPVTRQSLQTARVHSLASDLFALGMATHNSLRAQEPTRPQAQDLDLLTARHWTRLGLQARQPGSPLGLRTPRFDLWPSTPSTVLSGQSPTSLAGQPTSLGDQPSELWTPWGSPPLQPHVGSLGAPPSKPWDHWDPPTQLPATSLGELLSSHVAPQHPCPLRLQGSLVGLLFRALGAPPDPASPAPRDLGAVPRRPRDT